jgi:uncharacterized protein (DUF362 family)
MTLSASDVAVCKIGDADYPRTTPFHPEARYPEYRGETGPANSVYAAVREAFHLLGLDQEHFDTTSWNPLKGIVRPGDKVVLKPNFLSHTHRYRPGHWNYVITHGAVIRAVLDYVLLALEGLGEVWIADGPQFDGDWQTIVRQTGIEAVCKYYCEQSAGVPIHLLDLRPEWWPDVRDDVTNRRETLPGDPLPAQRIDLGGASAFRGHQGVGRYYGSDYDQAETNAHHRDDRHEYLLSRTCTSADVLINLPKLKTHKKVGATLSLKNLVGINAGRNWLPHHTDGYPEDGGDAFPQPTTMHRLEHMGIRRFEKLMLVVPRLVSPLFRLAKRIARPIWGDSHFVIRNGNWHGNDTCWRMVHDINTCLIYSDGTNFPIVSAKRYLSVVDGIWAGEGDGPAAPDPVRAGVIAAGLNPVAVDAAVTWVMGFDPTRLAMIRRAFGKNTLPLVAFAYEDIRMVSNESGWNGLLYQLEPRQAFRFKAHPGWQGRIELPGTGRPMPRVVA